MAARSFVGSWPPSIHSGHSGPQTLPATVYERYRYSSRGRGRSRAPDDQDEYIRSSRGQDEHLASSVDNSEDEAGMEKDPPYRSYSKDSKNSKEAGADDEKTAALTKTKTNVNVSAGNKDHDSDADSMSVAKASLKSQHTRASKKSEKSEVQKRTTTGLRWIAVLGAVFSTMFLFALDNTIVANIQPAIIKQFGEVEKLAWIAVAFTLPAAGSVLLWGFVFSNFDCKWAYVTSVALFEAGSTICGASNSMDILIVGRAIAGFGAQGLYLGAMTFVGALTTPDERPLYVALSGAVWGLGTVLGPLIGGLFTDSSATWRWSFYINLCIGGVFLPVYLFILPSIQLQGNGSLLERWKKIDYVGALLLPGSITLFITGIVLGGAEAPWKSAKVICCFIFSVVVALMFLIQQHWTLFTTRANRMWPSGVKINLEIIILCIQCCNAGVVAFVTIFFLPLYYQFTRGITPVATAKEITPLVILLVFSALLSGGLVVKFNRYGPWFLVAAICSIAGGAIMYVTKVSTSNAQTYGAQVLIGIGSGLVMQLPFSIIQIKSNPKDVALVNGIITLFQIGALAVFISVANSIFLNVATKEVGKALPFLSRVEVEGLLSGASGELLMSLTPEQQALALENIVSAIDDTYILVITAGIINLLTSFLIMHQRVNPEPQPGKKGPGLESMVAKARKTMDLEANTTHNHHDKNNTRATPDAPPIATEKNPDVFSKEIGVTGNTPVSSPSRSPHKTSRPGHGRPRMMNDQSNTHPLHRHRHSPRPIRRPKKNPRRKVTLEISCTMGGSVSDDE